jgi:hypothetical protein
MVARVILAGADDMNVVAIGHNRLDFIKRRIAAGHERAEKGGAEWIEGSLEVAAALLEGREAIPSNITFRGWLIENKLDFYTKDDRMALLGLASDMALTRAILTETKSRSYLQIWRENKNRFRRASNMTGKRYTKPRNRTPGLAMQHRRMKLGDEIVDSLAETSLDSAAEMDELVMLNRGAEDGQLTDIVARLVADAIDGKDVSAIAETAKLGTVMRKHPKTLIEIWRKRMVFAWEQADLAEQHKLMEYLMDHCKKEDKGHD